MYVRARVRERERERESDEREMIKQDKVLIQLRKEKETKRAIRNIKKGCNITDKVERGKGKRGRQSKINI